LALQEKVPMDRILLSKNDGSPLEPTDSPLSSGLSSVDFISKLISPHKELKYSETNSS
jgi:hypothetical protein